MENLEFTNLKFSKKKDSEENLVKKSKLIIVFLEKNNINTNFYFDTPRTFTICFSFSNSVYKIKNLTKS
jgi:hypothetical protein